MKDKKKKATTLSSSSMIEKSDYTITLSPISILRRCESVGSEKAYLALDSETKYRDQWMKQASDYLNDSDRETLGLKLKKSIKSKMKQQAKKFCTTDQPLDEIQRGSLVNIYMFLFTKFNAFSSSLWILGPVYMSTNFTTMSSVIPSDLQRLVYNHLFKKRNDIAKQASSNSKSRVSSIDELIQKRENLVIYDIINKWLWKNLF